MKQLAAMGVGSKVIGSTNNGVKAKTATIISPPGVATLSHNPVSQLPAISATRAKMADLRVPFR